MTLSYEVGAFVASSSPMGMARFSLLFLNDIDRILKTEGHPNFNPNPSHNSNYSCNSIPITNYNSNPNPNTSPNPKPISNSSIITNPSPKFKVNTNPNSNFNTNPSHKPNTNPYTNPNHWTRWHLIFLPTLRFGGGSSLPRSRPNLGYIINLLRAIWILWAINHMM